MSYVVRFIPCPNPAAECAYCGHDYRTPAVWFYYHNAGTSNALALCNGHALSTLGVAWAMGATVMVSGQAVAMPEPFRT
jgi:hypothetical protein